MAKDLNSQPLGGRNASLNLSFQIKLEGIVEPQSIVPWKRNEAVDPKFPWHSRRNETGEIVYSIPLEAPTDIPVDDSEGAKKYRYSTLPLFGGKSMKVYWEETTNKEWAYDQKRWIDAEAKRNERLADHQIFVAEVLGDGSIEDGNHKTEWQLLDAESEDQDGGKDAPQNKSERKKGYTGPYREPRVEPFVLNKIEREELRAKMEAEDPKIWWVFSNKFFEGMDVETLASELKLSQPRIYQLLNKGKRIMAKHRSED